MEEFIRDPFVAPHVFIFLWWISMQGGQPSRLMTRTWMWKRCKVMMRRAQNPSKSTHGFLWNKNIRSWVVKIMLVWNFLTWSFGDPPGSLLPTKKLLDHQNSSFIQKISEGTTPLLFWFPSIVLYLDAFILDPHEDTSHHLFMKSSHFYQEYHLLTTHQDIKEKNIQQKEIEHSHLDPWS
jgi:hypothetical protein